MSSGCQVYNMFNNCLRLWRRYGVHCSYTKSPAAEHENLHLKKLTSNYQKATIILQITLFLKHYT